VGCRGDQGTVIPGGRVGRFSPVSAAMGIELSNSSCSFFGCGRLKITLCLGSPANPAITPFTPDVAP